MLAVSRNEIDAGLGENPAIETLMDRLGLRGGISRSAQALLHNDLFFSVRQGVADLLGLIEAGLDAITLDELAAIENRWMPRSESLQLVDRPVLLSAQERAWLADNPVLRVHNEMDREPFNFNVDGRAQGFSIDYMNLLVRGALLSVGVGEVVEASSGAEAIEKIREVSTARSSKGGPAPDEMEIACGITDFNMKPLNGIHVLKSIRTGDSGAPRNTPVVILTGHSDDSLVAAGRALDASGYVVKPVSRDDLLSQVNKATNRAFNLKPALSSCLQGSPGLRRHRRLPEPHRPRIGSKS